MKSPGDEFRFTDLPWRARATYLAHAFKAVAKQHHTALRPLLRRYLADDSTIFDVGAHAGQFTKLFAKLAPRGRVYSFEPGSYARSILEIAVRSNRLRNVTLVPTGLGDAATTLTLTVPVKPRGSYRFGLAHMGASPGVGPDAGPGAGPGADTVRTERVEVDTIDIFAAAEGLTRLDFLKADIEGWEQRMIEGGRETLSRFRPIVMIEMVESHLNRAGDSLASAWDLLRSIGYRPYLWDGHAGLSLLAEPREGDIFWLADGV